MRGVIRADQIGTLLRCMPVLAHPRHSKIAHGRPLSGEQRSCSGQCVRRAESRTNHRLFREVPWEDEPLSAMQVRRCSPAPTR